VNHNAYICAEINKLEDEPLVSMRRSACTENEGDGAGAATPPTTPVSPELSAGAANGIFKIWVLIYALVGAQMGWLLRPFIGHPDVSFTWFRDREGNFFTSVFEHARVLIGW